MKIFEKICHRILREMVKHKVLREVIGKGYNFLVSNPNRKLSNNKVFNFHEESIVEEIKMKGHSSVFMMNKIILKEILEDLRNHSPIGLSNRNRYNIDYDNPVNPCEEEMWYQYENINEWQSVKKIISDEKINKVAASYLGNNPIVQNIHIWWSFHGNDELVKKFPGNYGWHYDIDNIKFLKIFTNLINVDLQTGPHKIYSNTHIDKSWFQKRNRRLTDELAEKHFRNEQLQTMIGKAGTSFFEDTLCYHKGTNPIKPRLLFQVEFSLTNYKIG